MCFKGLIGHSRSTKTISAKIMNLLNYMLSTGIVQFTMDIIDRENGKKLQAVNSKLIFEEVI